MPKSVPTRCGPIKPKPKPLITIPPISLTSKATIPKVSSYCVFTSHSLFCWLLLLLLFFFCSFISPRSFDFVPRGIASPAFDCNCRAAVVHAVDRLLSTLVGRFYERCNRLPSSVSRCGRVNHKLSVRKAHTKERRNRRRDEEMGNGCFFFEGGVGYS